MNIFDFLQAQQQPQMPVPQGAQVQTMPYVPEMAPQGTPLPPVAASAPAPMPMPAIPLASATPAEVPEQGGQMNWLDTQMAKPNMRQALLIAGLNMMQRRRGESLGSQLSRGALQGVNYYEGKKEIDRRAGLERERQDNQNRTSAASATGMEIDNKTRGAKNQAELDTSQAAAEVAMTTVQDTIAKIKSQAEAAGSEAERQKIVTNGMKRIEAIRLKNPGLEEKIFMAEAELKMLAPKEAQADISQKNAAAGYSSALAKRQGNLTALEELDLEDQKTLTPEQRLQRSNTKSATQSGQLQWLDRALSNWDQLNPKPDGTDKVALKNWQRQRAQFEKGEMESLKSAKINRVAAVKAVLDSSSPDSPEYKQALQDLQSMGVTNEELAAASTGAPGATAPGQPTVRLIMQNGKLVPAGTMTADDIPK